MGAATGAAEGSDAVGVDFGAAGEVVDGADSVPSEGAGKSVTDESRLEAGFAMFAGGGFEKGFGCVGGVGILEALTLTDGVVGEDREAVAGEGAGEGVVGGFAGEAVARGDDDGWEFLLRRTGFGVGEIEKRGDGKVRLGLVEDFFDAEAFACVAPRTLALSGVFSGRPPMRVRILLRTSRWRASAWARVVMAAMVVRRAAVSLAAMSSR